MEDFPTLSPLFGCLFALAGLGLAILLGLVLYPVKKPGKASSRKPFIIQKEGKTA